MNIAQKLSRLTGYLVLVILCANCATPDGDPGVTTNAQGSSHAEDIAGDYQLVAVNAVRVPGAVFHDAVEIEVHSGSFRIDANGSAISETEFSPPSGERITRKATASYLRQDTRLVFRWDGAGMTSGRIEGELFVMNNHGMILVYSRSGTLEESVDLARLGHCGAGAKVERSTPGVFDNFDFVLPRGFDCYGISIGFFTFRDSEETTVRVSTTADHPPRPEQSDVNRALQLDLDIKGWGGVIHNFENQAIDNWTPRDWSAFDAFSFWIYGNNSGTSLFIDILDNRKPGSTYDDAERYTHTFTDDFIGWKKIIVPFRQMTRKHIGNQAPNDGFGLTAVNGWGLGTLDTNGPITFYLDDFELILADPGLQQD